MPEIDPNLVQQIATQVLAALRAHSGRGAKSPAEIHAPIGECTGDYSKFPELKNLQSAPAPVTAAAAPSATNSPASTPQPTLLTGVITVSHLRSLKGPIRLAKNAILTPLAQDYIKDKNLNVTADGQSPTTVTPVNSNTPTFWWIDGQCPSVAKVIETLRPNTLASRERSSPDNLRNVVKELASHIKTKRLAAGLLFVQSAARAAVYANRCHSLRAVVATSDKAIADAIDLGANTLILEFPQLGFKGMMALIKPFLESTHLAPPTVQKELNELATCG